MIENGYNGVNVMGQGIVKQIKTIKLVNKTSKFSIIERH